MASSVNQDSWLNSNYTTPTPIAFDDHAIPGSISPLSLSHNFFSPTASERSPLYPDTQPAPALNRTKFKDSKYSKKEMVYRAIDDKIDLVRFLQAYESIIAAFGVETRELNDEREKEKLDVAERIVYRLFWNDRNYAANKGSESVPLTHGKADNQVLNTDTNTLRQLRVTASEIDAISAIVDEAYEGLRMAPEPVIDNILKKGKVTPTITEVREVADETDSLVNENTNSTNGVVEHNLCVAAGPKVDTSAEKGQITSKVTEVVEALTEIDIPLVEFLKDGGLDEGRSVLANHVTNIIDEKTQIFSTISEVTEAPRNLCLAIRSKPTSDSPGPHTIISIKPEASTSIETLYEQIMKSPEILLVRRWGRERYNEWKRENAKAQTEIAKHEIFRLMEFKHRFLPLESGNQPYTYDFASFTQNHRDSSALQLWSFNPVERTEELLNVKLLWKCEASSLKSITVEPLNLDEMAADETKGHQVLRNAYAFLGFWDWSVRSPCKRGAKAKPMHQICLQWLDPNNVFRRAYFQKRSVSNTSEKIERNREGSGSRDTGSWRDKRSVSGANYVGGKKRCVSGGWYGAKKRRISGISGNSGKRRKVGGERV